VGREADTLGLTAVTEKVVESNKGANMKASPLQQVCVVLACVAMAAGAVGMVASFAFMASRDIRDITAGASGFVAGALLIGSGLVSLAILATRPNPTESAPISSDRWEIRDRIQRPDSLTAEESRG
jgi:hypothetical protein